MPCPPAERGPSKKSIEGKQGLEDVLTNEILLASSWEVRAEWSWKGPSHINVLEKAAALRAYEAEAMKGGDLRFVSLIDSHVALCALTRGRSASGALRHLLKRASAISLYQAGRFAPTMRRWVSNWPRLSLLLCPSWIDFFTDRSCQRRYGLLLDFEPPALGFPGEGPASCSLLGLLLLLASTDVGRAVGASHGDEHKKNI